MNVELIQPGAGDERFDQRFSIIYQTDSELGSRCRGTHRVNLPRASLRVDTHADRLRCGGARLDQLVDPTQLFKVIDIERHAKLKRSAKLGDSLRRRVEDDPGGIEPSPERELKLPWGSDLATHSFCFELAEDAEECDRLGSDSVQCIGGALVSRNQGINVLVESVDIKDST